MNEQYFVLPTYPVGYSGQSLSDNYLFITELADDAMQAKGVLPSYYLQHFANEVARGKSKRSQQYLAAYRVGQRILWTFPGEDIAFLSLVVLLPEGPRSVMCISTKECFCVDGSNLDYQTETVTRWAIESQVGTSTHCK